MLLSRPADWMACEIRSRSGPSPMIIKRTAKVGALLS